MKTAMRYDDPNTLDAVLLKYSESLTKLEQLGVRLPAACRLREYENRFGALLAQTGDLLAVPEDEATELLFYFREMDEIILIANSFQDTPTTNELDRLRVLSGGSENPDSEQTAKARDAQFELFLRAAFIKAGAGVVFGSPDLTVSVDGKSFPLEAKRPTSERAFEDRLRGAVSQLENLDEPGVAAMSLDQLIRPAGGYLSLPTPETLGDATKVLLETYMFSRMDTIVKRVRGKKLAALLLVFRVPARALDTNLTLLGTCFLPSAIAAPWQPGGRVVQSLENLVRGFSV